MLHQLTPAQMKENNSFHRGLRLESVTPISAIYVSDQAGDEVSPFATITSVMEEWAFRILSPLEGGVKKKGKCCNFAVMNVNLTCLMRIYAFKTYRMQTFAGRVG